MSYKPGDLYYVQFGTSHPTTGAATNADSLPVATAYRGQGGSGAAFALTVTNVATGLYGVSGTIPAGWAAGDTVTVEAAATVATVAGRAPIDKFVLDSKRNADLQDLSSAGAQSAAATALAVYDAATGSDVAAIDPPTVTEIRAALFEDPDNKLEVTEDGMVVVAAIALTPQAVQAAIRGSDVYFYQSETNTIPETGLTNLPDRDALYIALKADEADEDEDALLLISEDGAGNASLLYIDGAAPPSLPAGSVTVTVDEEAESVTLVLKSAAAALLPSQPSNGKVYYALKAIHGANSYTIRRRMAHIKPSRIKAIA